MKASYNRRFYLEKELSQGLSPKSEVIGPNTSRSVNDEYSHLIHPLTLEFRDESLNNAYKETYQNVNTRSMQYLCLFCSLYSAHSLLVVSFVADNNPVELALIQATIAVFLGLTLWSLVKTDNNRVLANGIFWAIQLASVSHTAITPQSITSRSTMFIILWFVLQCASGVLLNIYYPFVFIGDLAATAVAHINAASCDASLHAMMMSKIGGIGVDMSYFADNIPLTIGIFFVLSVPSYYIIQQQKYYYYYQCRLRESELRNASKESSNNLVAEKLQYVAQHAHDLGTPLQALSNGIEVIRRTELTEEQSMIVATQQEAVDMIRMTRDRALSLARCKTGADMLPNYAPVSIAEILEKCQRIISDYMPNRNLCLIFQLSTKLLTSPLHHDGQGDGLESSIIDPYMLSDKEWLVDMLLNYLSNACKNTTSGSITVTIYPILNGRGLRLDVSDTGRGIADADKGKIFKPFKQLRNIPEPTKHSTDEEEDKASVPKPVQLPPVRIGNRSRVIPEIVIDIESGSDAKSVSSKQSLWQKTVQFPSTTWSKGSQLLTPTLNRTPLSVDTSMEADFKTTSPSRSAPTGRRGSLEWHGTGLGLFGVRSKAIAMNGFVGIEDNEASEIGGSTFFAVIPYIPCDKEGDIIINPHPTSPPKRQISTSSPYKRRATLHNLKALVTAFSVHPGQSYSDRSDRSHRDATPREFVLPHLDCVNNLGICVGSMHLPQEDAIGTVIAILPKRRLSQAQPEASSTLINPPPTINLVPETTPSSVGQLVATTGSTNLQVSQLLAGDNDEKETKKEVIIGTALVVDDSDILRSMLAKCLTNRHVKVDTAEDGDVGLKMMKKKMYDVVVTDYFMPNMDGLKLLKAIRAYELQNGRQRQLIVMSSGAIDEGFRDTAMEAGADAVLPKPIKVSDVIALFQK